MTKTSSPLTRRTFLKTSIAATAGAATLPLTGRAFIHPLARYTRYNVTSTEGLRHLASYKKAIQVMLDLPPTNPQNWFRNAFIHIFDCPHGNWWFYSWHRGFLGYFEETIRNLSGDSTFAIPFWDWTTLPQIPDVMFDGVLTPTDPAYAPYTKNFAVFTNFIQAPLRNYWNSLNQAQRNQLNIRGYTNFDLMWSDVAGFDPVKQIGLSGNLAYAINCGARYLSRDNPKFDSKTEYAVSKFIIDSGLNPTEFYNPDMSRSFNSAKLDSHNRPPGAFSILENYPHNKVHNYIGGVGPLDPGPYGNMTNFLSPVDPIFFLHHSNMDRLCDVWTRKQQSMGLPYLPSAADAPQFDPEPFLFYVNGRGEHITNGKAADFLSMARFDYQYGPGGYPNVFDDTETSKKNTPGPSIRGTVKANKVTLTVPSNEIQEHIATPRAATLIAEVSLPHPTADSPTREFDVIVGAPADVTSVEADSPYYAGTLAFFGSMAHAHTAMSEARFAVPLPKSRQAFKGLEAANSTVEIRIVPTHGRGKAPIVKSAILRSR